MPWHTARAGGTPLIAGLLVLLVSGAWAQGFGAFLSPGPLSSSHADSEGLTQCVACHEPGGGVSPARCEVCHDGVAKQRATDQGFHAGKEACGTCHPDHRGRDFVLVHLDRDDFDHDVTGFPLRGAHAESTCEDCHDEPHWPIADPSCAACHRDDEPHGAQQGRTQLIEACDRCHTSGRWEVGAIPQALFNHTDLEQVDYPLTGRHADVACVDCHLDARFKPTEHDACTSCHEPVHHSTALQGVCEDCHSPAGWGVEGFDHALTGFALQGQHARASCDSCHDGLPPAEGLPHGACEDCHRDIHRSQFVPRTCSDCHTVFIDAFRLPDFDHATTAYPLRGAHPEASCEACHGPLPGSQFAGRDHEDCDSCHDDPHAGDFEPSACQVCHDDAVGSWAVQDFDHARTRFPLVGQHAEVDCASCHPNEQWRVPFDTCDTCHTEHPHQPTAPPQACNSCHEPDGFVPPSFDHDATPFPLGERHGDVACVDCHDLTDFAGVPDTCEGCHERPAGHFDGPCADCHTSPGWRPATLGDLDHDATGFPLDGSHASVACDSCHPTGRPYAAATSLCVSCHADDDIHRHLLGDVCSDCHTPTAWLRTRFRHQSTGWPLRGAHRLAACVDCHVTRYVGTPTDCWRCHEAQAPRDVPEHNSVFFPQCDTCHRPFTWAVVRAVH